MGKKKEATTTIWWIDNRSQHALFAKTSVYTNNKCYAGQKIKNLRAQWFIDNKQESQDYRTFLYHDRAAIYGERSRGYHPDGTC